MSSETLLKRSTQSGHPLGKGVKLVTLMMTEPERRRISEVIKVVRTKTKTKITRSFILREGARHFCTRLMRELEKANRGELHAKKRQHHETEQTKEIQTVSGRGREQQRKQVIRRRRTVGDYRSQQIQKSR